MHYLYYSKHLLNYVYLCMCTHMQNTRWFCTLYFYICTWKNLYRFFYKCNWYFLPLIVSTNRVNFSLYCYRDFGTPIALYHIFDTSIKSLSGIGLVAKHVRPGYAACLNLDHVKESGTWCNIGGPYRWTIKQTLNQNCRIPVSFRSPTSHSKTHMQNK